MNVGPQDGALRLASISIGQDIQRQRHRLFICDQRVTLIFFKKIPTPSACRTVARTAEKV